LDLHRSGLKLKENDMKTETQTLYHRDGHEETFGIDKVARMVTCGQVGAGKDWSSIKPPPQGWEREVPRYRIVREVHPAAKSRFRFEPPFAHSSDSDAWQYGTRTHMAGEIIDTKEWPHPSFHPENYSARRVLDFYNSRQKSRLTRSPWLDNSVRLGDADSGPAIVSAVPPQLKPMDLRPAS
jgi:hypothetical protein